MFKKILILPLVLISIFCIFNSAHAQLLSSDISIDVNPKNPKANQEVRVALSSYSTDLNQAKISWFLNNSKAYEGIGKKEFVFTANNQNSQTIIEAIIETLNGSIINKKITISLNSVDLLWQASSSYSPPFYKGKALVPPEGTFKMVAIPTSSGTLGYSYKWKQDGNYKTDSSGYGKSFYTFKNSYLDKTNEVEVAITDLFGNNIGNNRISLSTIKPEILFYQKDAGLGTLWNQTLENGFMISQNGVTFVAESYFFSPKDLTSNNFSFSWYVNGDQIETPDPKNVLSVIQENKESGSAEIKLVIDNLKTLFQKSENKINVNF